MCTPLASPDLTIYIPLGVCQSRNLFETYSGPDQYSVMFSHNGDGEGFTKTEYEDTDCTVRYNSTNKNGLAYTPMSTY
jgi:hypothetical protein